MIAILAYEHLRSRFRLRRHAAKAASCCPYANFTHALVYEHSTPHLRSRRFRRLSVVESARWGNPLRGLRELPDCESSCRKLAFVCRRSTAERHSHGLNHDNARISQYRYHRSHYSIRRRVCGPFPCVRWSENPVGLSGPHTDRDSFCRRLPIVLRLGNLLLSARLIVNAAHMLRVSAYRSIAAGRVNHNAKARFK